MLKPFRFPLARSNPFEDAVEGIERGRALHLIFVSAIIASVVAVLGVFQPATWVWALSLLWIALFGLLNYDHHRDRVAILNGLKRRDNALVYTKLVDTVLGGLRRMLYPPTQ